MTNEELARLISKNAILIENRSNNIVRECKMKELDISNIRYLIEAIEEALARMKLLKEQIHD